MSDLDLLCSNDSEKLIQTAQRIAPGASQILCMHFLGFPVTELDGLASELESRSYLAFVVQCFPFLKAAVACERLQAEKEVGAYLHIYMYHICIFMLSNF